MTDETRKRCEKVGWHIGMLLGLFITVATVAIAVATVVVVACWISKAVN